MNRKLNQGILAEIKRAGQNVIYRAEHPEPKEEPKQEITDKIEPISEPIKEADESTYFCSIPHHREH